MDFDCSPPNTYSEANLLSRRYSEMGSQRHILWQVSIPMSFSEIRWLDMRAFVLLEFEMDFEDIGCITVTFKPG